MDRKLVSQSRAIKIRKNYVMKIPFSTLCEFTSFSRLAFIYLDLFRKIR